MQHADRFSTWKLHDPIGSDLGDPRRRGHRMTVGSSSFLTSHRIQLIFINDALIVFPQVTPERPRGHRRGKITRPILLSRQRCATRHIYYLFLQSEVPSREIRVDVKRGPRRESFCLSDATLRRRIRVSTGVITLVIR